MADEPTRRRESTAATSNGDYSPPPVQRMSNGAGHNRQIADSSSELPHQRAAPISHSAAVLIESDTNGRSTDGGKNGRESDGDEAEEEAAAQDEEESFVDWLERYRVGTAGPSDRAPAPPSSIRAILEGRAPDDPLVASPGLSESPSRSSVRSCSSTTRTSTSSLPSMSAITAATLLDFYRKKGHFPAPPGPFEEERLRLAHKYGLDQPVRRLAIDRICAIAKAYFKTKTVVISLTFDDHQVLGAEKGWGGEEPGLDVPPRPLTLEPAFCTVRSSRQEFMVLRRKFSHHFSPPGQHAMLASYRDPKAVFLVGNADRDWRFQGSPYSVGNGGGVAFYAAANVNLPVAKQRSGPRQAGVARTERTLPETLASGAVCLIDPVPRSPESFSAEDREILTDFADMISLEFQRGYEQRRREQEAQQADFVGRFLRQALVLPAQPYEAQTGSRDKQFSSGDVYRTAVREIRKLTHAGSAAILDLRAFQAKKPPAVLPITDKFGVMVTSEDDDAASDSHGTRPGFSRASTVRGRRRQRSSNTLSPESWVSNLDDRGYVTVLSSDGDVDWARSEEDADALASATDATLQTYYAVSLMFSFDAPVSILVLKSGECG